MPLISVAFPWPGQRMWEVRPKELSRRFLDAYE